MDKIIISSDKLIDNIVNSYDREDQKTVEIQHGQHLLFADCRFIHNSFMDKNISPDRPGYSEVTHLVNFYIYEATLYKDGEFVSEKEWDFDNKITETEKEIFQRLK